MRRIRVILNPRSGARSISTSLLQTLDSALGEGDTDLTFQISRSPADGREKTRRAVGEGADTVIAVGGDGMVNTIGGELMGTGVALGVIPAGSGNGFARHFGLPLQWNRAAEALARSDRHEIDVGAVNGRPFFVTCSLAWDAEIVKWFERSPVRGVLPYVMSAAYGLFEYTPQPFEAVFDDGERVTYDDPIVFTAANLTQFGGGARIAPEANAQDGRLELVVVLRRDTMQALAGLGRLFDGTIARLSAVHTRSFRNLVVTRRRPAPVQIDGELLPPERELTIEVLDRKLTVLVPRGESAVRR